MLDRYDIADISMIYPRIACMDTWTADEFERSFAVFVQAFAPGSVFNGVMTREVMLESVITSAVRHDAGRYAPSINELADGLSMIGAAMLMLIQLEAIRDNADAIDGDRLGAFITRFDRMRRFVLLDDDCREYAIVG